jgi:hypothetical protein
MLKMPGETRRIAQLVRTNLGDAKDPKNHRNYNRTAIEVGRREPKAYEANMMRIIRYLICSEKRGSIKLGSNAIDSGSDIRSGSKAAAGLQQWEPID